MPRNKRTRQKEPTPRKTQKASSTRKGWIVGISAAVAAAVAFPLFAPSTSDASFVNEASLMKDRTLEEMSIGRPDAPVTIVEYASLTCGHCARFAVDVFPEVKKKLVDTGEVRFVMREFPLEPVAMAGAMVARCAPEGTPFDVTKKLFDVQSRWIQSSDRAAALATETAEFGMDVRSVRDCLENVSLQREINAVKNDAGSMGVTSTPTFFVNGEKIQGAVGFDRLKAAVSAARSRSNPGSSGS